MAELLIKAKSHWMDKLSQAEADKMTKEQRQSYEARSQKGDIIVVRPDGWQWGKEECLPNFIVVKLSEVSVEDAKKYEQPIIEIEEKKVKLSTAERFRMLKANPKEFINQGSPTEKIVKIPRIIRSRKYSISQAEVDKKAVEVKDFKDIVPVELSVNETILEKVINGDTAKKDS